MTSLTAAAVSSDTAELLLSTRETVATDTPAALATSLIVTLIYITIPFGNLYDPFVLFERTVLFFELCIFALGTLYRTFI